MKKRRGRNISGILVLDKPEGESSNRSLQKVKRLYQAAKAGHTGSLDPLATGVLPLCFGEATKISQFPTKLTGPQSGLGLKLTVATSMVRSLAKRMPVISAGRILNRRCCYSGVKLNSCLPCTQP